MPAKARILVVGDEPKIHEVGPREYLQLSFNVVTAANGEEALACAREQRIDLMLPRA